jgi:hypothetical protein
VNEEFESPDNLAAAVDAVGTNLGRRKKASGADGDQQQVLIRAPKESHERWKTAAEKQGISMSEFVRTAADQAAADLLDCAHGVEHRRWYPWEEHCLKCGIKLRDRKKWLVDPSTFPQIRPANGNPAAM